MMTLKADSRAGFEKHKAVWDKCIRSIVSGGGDHLSISQGKSWFDCLAFEAPQ